ncbi:MAG: hypothetical protein J5J06_16455 [Phycisphaerae bacterium]|nr:hypothetical protein [Phycisphaerae bacterium]
MLAESLATLESVLGVDLRALTRSIAENLVQKSGSNPQPAATVMTSQGIAKPH